MAAVPLRAAHAPRAPPVAVRGVRVRRDDVQHPAAGSGKTTLLRLLDGLYFPAEGAVRFCGDAITARQAHTRTPTSIAGDRQSD